MNAGAPSPNGSSALAIVGWVFHRRETTSWLAGSHFDGGLTIPGRARRDAADLQLSPNGVCLISPKGDERASLDWSEYAEEASSEVADSDRNCWTISPWTFGRSGPIGIGVAVGGRCVTATSSVRAQTRTWRNRLNRWLQEGAPVPLYATGHISAVVNDDRDTVQMLCSLLAQRPTIRPRLAERERVERLTHDLTANRHGTPSTRRGVRRSTVEITTAMRLMGYTHRFHGRPLPDEELPNSDHVVSRVHEHIESSPYARGLAIDESAVRSVVVRDYLNVEPWPVHALID